MTMNAFCSRLLTVIVIKCSVTLCIGQKWYNFRLLANPGLTVPNIVSSSQDCINQCVANSKCSAVSYQQWSQQCVFSYCAHLEMTVNRGRNTYVLYQPLIEGRDFPAPQLEWMLTDQCGLSSTGRLANMPAMVPAASTSYSASQSSLQGNAVLMNGVGGSNCVTEQSSQLNLSIITNGFTMSGWYYLESAASDSYVLFEFGTQADIYYMGTQFWIFGGQLYYNLAVSGYSDLFTVVNLPIGTWFHAALVYDPAMVGMFIFLNATQKAFNSIGTPLATQGSYAWNVVSVGSRPSNVGAFPGRAYCVRFHQSALDEDQILNLATSCRTGRIRFN